MKLSELGDLNCLEECADLAHQYIWNRHIDDISDADLQIVHHRLVLKKGRESADECLITLKQEAQLHHVLGNIKSCPVVNFSLKQPPLLLSELIRLLARFDVVDRKAIIFALEMELSLKEVSALTRPMMKNLDLKQSKLAEKIVQSMPAHLTCRRVFWRFDENSWPEPLTGLESRFKSHSGESWAKFKDRLGSMISDCNSLEFMTAIY